jgi:hypothetical protein
MERGQLLSTRHWTFARFGLDRAVVRLVILMGIGLLLATTRPAQAVTITVIGTPGNDQIEINETVDGPDPDPFPGLIRRNGVVIKQFNGNLPNIFIVDTRGGNDVVIIFDGGRNDVYRVMTRSGRDTLRVKDGRGKDQYRIDTGSGDDTLSITDAKGIDRYHLQGGTHVTRDRLNITDSFADPDTIVPALPAGFETITGAFM